MFVGLLQYFLLPLLLNDGFAIAFISNLLYFIAVGTYFYVSFLGFLTLPFVSKEIVSIVLAPIVFFAFFFLLLSLFGKKERKTIEKKLILSLRI